MVSQGVSQPNINLNMFKNNSARKINLFCSDFGMHQSITEPTHYTERSEPSLIDLILVHNPDSLVASGVGDPFLEQNLRFHCPIFGLLKFPNTKVKSYTRQIWNYALGNYDLLRAKASETEWDSLRHASLDTYVINFTNHILQLAKECIPNKLVRIRPADPPWLTSYIERFICKRKRAYRKAKQTDLAIHWEKFRRLRNKVTLLIRESKQAHTDKVANKLKSDSISSRSWWSILKSFISPTFKTAIPPLDHNGRLYTEEQEKANLLNTFFCEQTILKDVVWDIFVFALGNTPGFHLIRAKLCSVFKLKFALNIPYYVYLFLETRHTISRCHIATHFDLKACPSTCLNLFVVTKCLKHTLGYHDTDITIYMHQQTQKANMAKEVFV